MSILADDVMTQLAFAVYQNKGVFTLLLGSGLSRSAGIPTGWEITLDLVRRVACAQGVSEQADWAAWYREKTGGEPDYSALLQELGSSPDERRAIIHGYIEPTKEDREEGRKVPTAAHRAIAELVRGGYIRVIVTTNFDRLIENALREVGVEPTVVASIDALAGAEPITHSSCYILKLHGDYKDARILNIESELSIYPSEYNALLDRIFDEHGLVVCGWSGEWDHALRTAILRAPNRRYSVFWAAHGKLGSGADDLVAHRHARIVSIKDADSFFAGLRLSVETLEQSHRMNPQSVELLIESVKRFLAKHEYRIQLDELIAQEIERALPLLDSPDFTAQGQLDKANLESRIKRYEAIIEPVAAIAGVLGRWGDGNELPLVLDVIRALLSQSDKVRGGLTIYLNLRSYPAVLVFTAYALGLTRAGRLETLHRFLDAAIDRPDRETSRLVETLFLEAWKGTEFNSWKQIEGYEKRLTPLSDYLFTLFSNWGNRFLGLVPDFELLFGRFEMLASLVFLERYTKSTVHQALAPTSQPGWARMPVGRIGWHSASRRLVTEITSTSMKKALVDAHFGHGDPAFIDLFVDNFERIAGHMSWW